MEYQDLLVDIKDNIATVTLNVPQKLNALTAAMSASIGQAAQDLAHNDEVRVVIVTGSGRGFCSGADVSAMLSHGKDANALRFSQTQFLGFPHADAFPRLNKPVIAAINGACAGGGLSLALSCDIRIATETARFGAAQVQRGLVPDYGMTMYLPLVAGVSNAFKLMYTAQLISAAEALEMGIISQVVPPEKLMETANTLAATIAQNPPYSLELTKLMVWRGMLDSLSRQLDLESWAQKICFTTQDHQSSVQAFLNKLPTPKYQGK